MNKQFILESEDDLLATANEILNLAEYKIFILSGDLGAGKTTFTKSVMRLLNSEDEASSPTFSLINEYHAKDEIFYHIDLYRLERLEEVIDIGIEDYLYSGNYCFIEWPQIIQSILPDEHHSLEFHILDNDKRKIIFS